MRIQAVRLAIAASLLLASSIAATAAQNVTIVGTLEGKTTNTLQVRTDQGLQTFSTEGMDLDPTLATGDIVRVSYSDVDGRQTAHSVGRVVSVTVVAPGEAGERMLVESVEGGTLASIAGKGDVKAEVMLITGNDRLTIRTLGAGVGAPMIMLRARVLDSDTTDFRTGDPVLLNVSAAAVNDELYVSTEPVPSEPDARMEYEPVPTETQPVTETAQLEADRRPTTTPRTTGDTRTTTTTTGSMRDENRLPQTASALHATGLIGLAALALGLGIGVARRLW